MPIARPVLQDKLCMGMTRKFDLAHEREFERMEGLGMWYAKWNAVLPARGPQRVYDIEGNGGGT